MSKSSRAVSVADLGKDPSGVVRRVRRSRHPVVIRESGRAQAVLLSLEAYERNQREHEILRELARGEREIAAGRGFSLTQVLKDADKVLKRARK
jgi:prevent-host-death family protein